VACQVCHSAGPYKSCFNCHVGQDGKGLAYFKTDPSQMTFKIGRNLLQSEERPWNYVLVRHAPTARDTFAFYGENLLPDYDQVPTWKYAAVHNIQRVTPQNQDCNNCHGQTELFLTEADVDADELEANRDVIVREVPEAQ
jgi:thiosulfate/3-mercaptopyruvate sulfurtransferase